METYGTALDPPLHAVHVLCMSTVTCGGAEITPEHNSNRVLNDIHKV